MLCDIGIGEWFRSFVRYGNNFSARGRMTDTEAQIPLFYAGQSVLLTGGTGFVGKVCGMTASVIEYAISFI